MRKEFPIPGHYHSILALRPFYFIHGYFEINRGHDSIAELFIDDLFDGISIMHTHFCHTIDMRFLSDAGIIGPHRAFAELLKKVFTEPRNQFDKFGFCFLF